MRKLISFAALIALAASSGAQDAKQYITNTYKQIDKLFAARDGDGLDKFMRAHVTKNFYSISNGQKSNIDQNLAPLKPMFSRLTSIHRPPTTIKSIVVAGSRATATLTGGFSAEMTGKDGKSHTIAGGSDAIDHWIKTKTGWLIEKTEISHQTFTIDGKAPAQTKK